MIEIKADFFTYAEDYDCDALVCTINGVVRSNGRLVMGAGIAKAFKLKFPGLDLQWGSQRNKYGKGLLYSCINGTNLIGLPTKGDWKKPSSVEFVKLNLDLLLEFVDSAGFKRVLMTRPGCGNGGLNWKNDVRPLMKNFDDRYAVCSI